MAARENYALVLRNGGGHGQYYLQMICGVYAVLGGAGVVADVECLIERETNGLPERYTL